MNSWVGRLGANDLDARVKDIYGPDSDPENPYFQVWLGEVDRLLPGVETHSELPDWEWHNAYMVKNASPSEAVKEYLEGQAETLILGLSVYLD